MLVLRRGENRSTRRKTSRSRQENQQQTYPPMTTGPGIPGTHWWEASALTTAPSLLPQVEQILIFPPRGGLPLSSFLEVLNRGRGSGAVKHSPPHKKLEARKEKEKAIWETFPMRWWEAKHSTLTWVGWNKVIWDHISMSFNQLFSAFLSHWKTSRH